MAQSKRLRPILATVGLFLCMSLQSCFTTGLWASDIRGEHKAILTPVSLALDVVTLPAQLAVVDHSAHGRRHHHDRGYRARRRCR